MEGEQLRQGRQRVQDHLIEPLERMGMTKKPSCKMDQHAAFLESLRNRLAYMTEGNLVALRDVVEFNAGGKHRDRWPVEINIINWARRLQIPPPTESRLVRSYIQSAAGRNARAEDCLVELFQHLRKYGAPPNDFGWSQIRQRASDRRGQLAKIQRNIAAGRATLTEAERLKGYQTILERCIALQDDVIKGEDAA